MLSFPFKPNCYPVSHRAPVVLLTCSTIHRQDSTRIWGTGSVVLRPSCMPQSVLKGFVMVDVTLCLEFGIKRHPGSSTSRSGVGSRGRGAEGGSPQSSSSYAIAQKLLVAPAF